MNFLCNNFQCQSDALRIATREGSENLIDYEHRVAGDEALAGLRISEASLTQNCGNSFPPIVACRQWAGISSRTFHVRKLERKKSMERLYRACEFDRAKIKSDSRTVECSFSSETPVDRGTYWEILDHSPGNADLSRLNDGGPLLLNHNTDSQIGAVSSARIENRKGRADLKFSQGALGTEIFNDVKDGIRKLMSIGYVTKDEISRKQAADGRPEIRFSWTAVECSIVPCPADETVGIGRSAARIQMNQNTVTQPDSRQAEIEAVSAFLQKTFPHAKRKIEASTAEAVLGDIEPMEFRKSMFAKISEFKGATDNIEGAEQIVNIHQGRGLDLGAQFCNLPGFKKFQEGRGTRRDFSGEVNLRQSNSILWRTTGDPATTVGLTSIEKQPGIVYLGVQPPRVADLMTQTPTGGTTVRYISENSLANTADFTAENGAYPEQTWDLVETDASVRKITAIARVTDEFFMDYDATRDYINTRLAYQVAIKEDNALLNATASSTSIKGLLQFSGIQTQPQGADTALNALFKAINKVRSVGFFEPDGIVLHPNDLQNFRLMTDKNGQYYFGGPFTGSYGQPGMPGSMIYIWGLPVIWTTSIAQGTALVGAFRMGAQIFRKLGLTIETTNSDASDFANGRLAVRATTRLALACYRPLAFCTVTGLT